MNYDTLTISKTNKNYDITRNIYLLTYNFINNIGKITKLYTFNIV